MSFATDESSDSNQQPEASKAAHWYAVQVASGCEKRVKTNLEQRVQTLDVADRILRVQIPQTPTVKIRKDGSRQHSDEKVFPGYVLVQMVMDDDAWQVVKIDMAVGDKIVVLSGPFKDFEGEVIEVSPERSKLKALLSIFGR
ncbi:MAG: transcription termination/antitermination protein NusG, partial [Coleofasciculus sp. C3-bin4]|nr:transcription termination/antitermination protein NusG [Coleofasciculus sp. C3-bin4]